MTVDETAELIRPAVVPEGTTWADLGAGTGLFTRALANLLEPGARIFAIDRAPHVLEELRLLARHAEASGTKVVAIRGDFLSLDAVRELAGVRLDGAIFANALHFTGKVAHVLSEVAGRLSPIGRIVVVEYDRRLPSPWVPHPIPPDRLRKIAREAGLESMQLIGERKSRFGGRMYCAVLEHLSAKTV